MKMENNVTFEVLKDKALTIARESLIPSLYKIELATTKREIIQIRKELARFMKEADLDNELGIISEDDYRMCCEAYKIMLNSIREATRIIGGK